MKKLEPSYRLPVDEIIEKIERRKMTAIDFTAEVEKRKEDLLADLFSLLKSTQNVMTARWTLSIHLDLVQ